MNRVPPQDLNKLLPWLRMFVEINARALDKIYKRMIDVEARLDRLDSEIKDKNQ